MNGGITVSGPYFTLCRHNQMLKQATRAIFFLLKFVGRKIPPAYHKEASRAFMIRYSHTALLW